MKFWTKRNETSVELFEKIAGPVDINLTGFEMASGAYEDEEATMAGHNVFGYKNCGGGILLIAADSVEEVIEKGYTVSEQNFIDTHTLAKVGFGLVTADLF